jgi:hypothetical protein
MSFLLPTSRSKNDKKVMPLQETPANQLQESPDGERMSLIRDRTISVAGDPVLNRLDRVITASIGSSVGRIGASLFRSLFGFDVRTSVSHNGKSHRAIFNIHKLAEEYGIATDRGRCFLKNILKRSESVEETLKQLEEVDEEGFLKEMADNKEIFQHPNFLNGKERTERSIAACRQGILITEKLMSRGPYEDYESLEEEGTLEKIRIIEVGMVGEGRKNAASLVWTDLKKFMVLRKHKAARYDVFCAGNKLSELKLTKRAPEMVVAKEGRVVNVHKYLEGQLKARLEPGGLETFEESDYLLRGVNGVVYALGELAVHGDLSKNAGLFKGNPKGFLKSLLGQLKFYTELEFATGGVSISSINIHKTKQGGKVPKYSGIGDGLCAPLVIKSLSESWTAFRKEIAKESPGRSQFCFSINKALDSLLSEEHENFSPEGKLKGAYDRFKQEVESVFMLGATLEYAFIDEKSYISFIKKTRLDLFFLFHQEASDAYASPDVKKCIKDIVLRMQRLDFLATGMTVIRHCLGEGSYIRNNLKRLLEFEDGVNPACRAELLNSLKEALKEDVNPMARLSDDSILFIIDIASGAVNPDEAGLLRLQRVIDAL